jgi:hypothetical protein
MIAIIEPGSAYPATLQLITKMSIDKYHWVRGQQQHSKPRKKAKEERKQSKQEDKKERKKERNSGRCIKSCTQRDRRDTESRAEERAERQTQRQRECREHRMYTSEALQDGMLGTSASDSHPQVYPCESGREVTMRLLLLLITSCSRNATGHCF